MVPLATDAPKKKTIAVLDGMRAIACLTVISYHFHYIMASTYPIERVFGKFGSTLLLTGWSGVPLFFVLSGFLLFLPYARAMLFETQWPSLRTFYIRRVLRILPGYYVALFVLILLIHPEYLHADHLTHLVLFLTFFMDAPSTYQQINGPFWSLAVEWQYYLLLPFLALAFGWVVSLGKSQSQKLWMLIGCLGVMMLWGVSTRYLGRYYYDLYPNKTILVSRPVLDRVLLIVYGGGGKYMETFAVGMLVSAIYVYTHNASPEHWLSKRLNTTWLWGTGLVLLCFLATCPLFPTLSFLLPFIGEHNYLSLWGYGIGYGLCIMALLYDQHGLKMMFENRVLCSFSHISYSVYMWHLPILLAFGNIVVLHLPHRFSLVYSAYILCMLLIIFPLSGLIYYTVERPWIRLGQTKHSKKNIASPDENSERRSPPQPAAQESSAHMGVGSLPAVQNQDAHMVSLGSQDISE